jgi:hypothetical protein
VERFRFADQYAFDFRGEPEHNSQDKEGTLANSNQRALKGFTPTFTLERDFGGLVGRYKLDWFFVKPFIPQPRGEGMSYEFAPHFPLTMRDLNNAVHDGVSDHAPITVDLPLGNPSAIRLAKGSHETGSSRPDVSGASLPRNPGDFDLVGINGRGGIRLVRNPRANWGTAVIRIDDRKSGRAAYASGFESARCHFHHHWRAAGP